MPVNVQVGAFFAVFGGRRQHEARIANQELLELLRGEDDAHQDQASADKPTMT